MALEKMKIGALGRPLNLGMLYGALKDELMPGQASTTNIKIAALGRPFTLGMLYDARRDELMPGVTLWDDKTLQENTSESSQHSSEFHISASDSIESKSSLLDVDASLKASFMCGMIEVGGSAKFLNDKKKFKNQSRVTFQYKATTKFKQLSMAHLLTIDKKQADLIQKSSATHVVTGIIYGAHAIFVFDSEKLEASSVQDIQGHMQAVTNKIPSFNIEGKLDIKLNDEEKALTEKFSCKFYGDFILERNPATFVDAVKTYVELPKLLGEKGENSVPMMVCLMPLKNLDPKAAKRLSGISIGLVRKAEDALEDLKEIEMRCNDSLDDAVVEHFPQIHKDLSSFHKSCNYYTSHLQQIMGEKFPRIRKGKEDESSIKKVFEDRHGSPFSHDKLSEWMDHKEREINIIRSCVGMMEGVKIVHSQSELDREVLAAGVEHAVCFVFTSLESADPCLDAMVKYVDTLKLRSTTEDPWYYSDEVLTKIREKAEEVHNLAKALKNNPRVCFLIASIANENYTGATIYKYKDGILVSKDFQKPEIPPVEEITDKTDLMWYACDLTLDPNTANKSLTLSEGNKKATCGETRKYPDHPERFDKKPQVLSKERLIGRHYWEVEWGNNPKEIKVGVAYHGIERKGISLQSVLGGNTMSWCLNKGPEKLSAWHNNDGVWKSSTVCGRVGVYLDWPAGTLSFYKVSSNTLSHLHTFHTKFTGHLYPGISVSHPNTYVYLRPFESVQ